MEVDAVVLEEMQRMGFWPSGEGQPTAAESLIRREAEPLITARDGLATLAATLAIETAAREDRTVTLDEMLGQAAERAVA